ncbi:MAG: DnaJ domain [Gammaproteobacteria bacterium]|jgi:curved DNA-binding protein CbpA|nr:DnaJ domain [Gammaproteobacteria bacterium]
MKNHYVTLGLNATGLRDTGEPYSTKDIRKAYHKAALKVHPDRSKTSALLFIKVDEAYKVLENPTNRERHNKELQQNPQTYIHSEHLFVFMNEEKEEEVKAESMVSCEGDEDIGTTLVLHSPSGIDLSQLLVNAECSSEKILGLARENFDFAKAILSNMGIFSLLRDSQQFELLFLIFNALLSNQQLHLMEEIWSKPSVKFMLDALRSKQCHDYQEALNVACYSNKEIAKEFLKFYPDLFKNLNKENLVSLSQVFYDAVPILITMYAKTLSTFELAFIIATYKENTEQVLSWYQQYSSLKQFEKLSLYLTLTNQINKGSLSDFTNVSTEDIRTLGTDAFSLIELLPDKITYLPNSFFVFNRLIDTETCESFRQKYNDRDQEIMRQHIMRFFNLYEAINKINEAKENGRIEPVIIPFKNLPIVDLLLKTLSFEEFKLFLKVFYFKYSEKKDDEEECINFVLNHILSPDENDMPFFLELLVKDFDITREFLKRNPQVLIKLLENKKYLTHIESHESLQKNLAAVLTSVSNIEINNLPGSLQQYYNPFNEFSQYVRSKQVVVFEKYSELVKVTEFFPQLVCINTDDVRIKHDILKKAAAHCMNYKSWEFNIQYAFDNWMQEIFITGSQQQVQELLTLYQKNSNIIFKILDKSTPYAILSLLMQCAQKPPYLVNQYFTGAALSTLQARLGTTEFATNLFRDAFRVISWNDYYPYVFPYEEALEKLESNAPTTDVDEILQETWFAFERAKLQVKYPSSPLSSLPGYFAFKQLPFVTQRLTAYQDLGRILAELENSEAGSSTDEILEKLIALLQMSGVDWTTLIVTQKSLKKHPFLFSALLTLINGSPNFELNTELRATIAKQNYVVDDIQCLAMRFSMIATYYIEKYHDTIPGNILSDLVKIHGEKILSVIKQYQLSFKLINGAKLNSVFSRIQGGIQKLENQVVSEHQIINGLIQKFLALADPIAPQSISRETVHEFYIELQTTIQKNEITNPELTALINGYQAQDEGNIFAWIIKLTFQQEFFAKDILMQWLKNEKLKQQVLPILYQLARGNEASQKKIAVSDIADLFDAPLLHDFINYHLTHTDPDKPDFEFIKDYIFASLQSGELTYSKLSNTFNINIQLLVLKEFFKKIEDLTLDKIRQIFINEDDFLPIIKGIIKSLYQLQPSAVTTLNILDGYLKTAEDLTEHSTLFSLNPNLFHLFPLLDQGILSLEKLNQLKFDSLEHQIYKAILQEADWIPVEPVISKLKETHRFFSSKYFTFIQEEVLKPFQDEVVRLNKEGSKKSQAMDQAKNNIIDLIINTCKDKELRGDVNNIIRTLHNSLNHEMEKIVREPEINAHRTYVKAFFKGLLGVLLAAPLFLIPLASERFQCTFFYATSKVAARKIKASVKQHTPDFEMNL